jgi:excinuclease ABC subunit B
MPSFRVESPFSPEGDQPSAIEQLVDGFEQGLRDQILLGVTGSGKTFTIAKLVERVNSATLILSHNKTLAAQLFQEFRSFFPHNSVEYFVSYYDYYQPEAYVPQSDTYIEKETSINEQIDRLRLRATKALFERRDVLIVASVSCIYGLGSPEAFYGMLQFFARGETEGIETALGRLVEMQYERTPMDLFPGSFRLRGDVLEIFPAYEDSGFRIEYFGDEIERISRFDLITGDSEEDIDRLAIYPKTHYVTPRDRLLRAVEGIEAELEERLAALETQGLLLERQRLEQRTRFDLEMLREVGYCHGIENYSRHLSGRLAGEPPPTLLDYLPDDFLLIADECHQTIPQVRAMYHGDRSRKETLVEFEEFEERTRQRLLVSATPGPWELSQTGGFFVEQLIRPTGLLDPEIDVRPATGQIDDLLGQIREVVDRGERVLVTTLTKRMAEELTQYLNDLGVRVRYLHSDIETLERVEIITVLRRGDFDVLVGINLLREGLDLPEVSLVAILDADKEGFLRSETSLIQTSGRAARNINGRVIFYADSETNSIRRAIDETARRRMAQGAYNIEHHIEPATIIKDIHNPLVQMSNLDYHEIGSPDGSEVAEDERIPLSLRISKVEKEMQAAARRLEFEQAAVLRDRLRELQEIQILRP